MRIVTGLALLAGCGSCPEALDPVDYTEDASWICRPGVDGVCADPIETWDALPDGSVAQIDSVPAEDPQVDCFYVYPTVDWGLRLGVHEDLDDRKRPEDVTRLQAARFHEVCDLWAPAYRQVKLGTFARDPEEAEPCFDAAYADASAAFDEFLAAADPSHGIVLIGHSQGSRMVARLLRERFDPDPALQERLVVALPTGWSNGDDAWESIPACAAEDDVGCAIGYRTYLAGEPQPEDLSDVAESDRLTCANPASPADPTTLTPVTGYFGDWSLRNRPEGVPDGDDVTVRYDGAFSARCVENDDGDGLLEVSWTADDDREPPFDLDAGWLDGNMGTHVLDLQLLQGTLIDSVRTRSAAWAEAR